MNEVKVRVEMARASLLFLMLSLECKSISDLEEVQTFNKRFFIFCFINGKKQKQKSEVSSGARYTMTE